MERKITSRHLFAAAGAVVVAGLLIASNGSAIAKTVATASASATPTPYNTMWATPTAKPLPASDDSNKFSLALIGDMPYDALGVAQTPNVINAINTSGVDFSLFDGDTMSGKGDKCTDENYLRIRNDFFNQFAKPIFYSVGDNEWTDCDRPVKGGYDPNERLAKVRSMFFKDAAGNYITLGKGVLTGTQILHDANYPEMQMFNYKKITFILPHVPGSADNSAVTSDKFHTYNDSATDGDNAEYTARDAADVAWINKGFQYAADNGSNGVIVVVQANMDWEGYLAGAAYPNNENTAAYDNVKLALLTNTLKFKKPVLLQNGDEHWYQVDMPMNETAGKLIQRDKGSLVENFTRVQTFGSGFNHWVQLDIDPSNPNLWSFTPRLVTANLAKH
jgi:hypothetical protein